MWPQTVWVNLQKIKGRREWNATVLYNSFQEMKCCPLNVMLDHLKWTEACCHVVQAVLFKRRGVCVYHYIRKNTNNSTSVQIL